MRGAALAGALAAVLGAGLIAAPPAWASGEASSGQPVLRVRYELP